MSQSMDLEQVKVVQQLRELKLTTMAQQLEELVRQGEAEGWGLVAFLEELLELELVARHDRSVARRLKEARFPEPKTLSQLDWQSLQGVERRQVEALGRCDWLDRGEAVVICGPIGTGKTHLAVGLGMEAVRRRRRVAFYRCAELVRQLVEARDERELGRLQRRLDRAELLIVDELGFVPFSNGEGELLFNLLAERYEQRSTLVTTNLAFGEWVQVFGSEKLTTALLDRLTHHSHILVTRGDSYRTRIRQKQQGKRADSQAPAQEEEATE